VYESVDISVLADTDADPVEGVLVRIFALDGQIVTESVTDQEGKVNFLLPLGHFSMRFYKFAVRFSMPQDFVVVATPYGGINTNVFDVKATVLTPPLATDSRFCRCSGYFRDATGAPKDWLALEFQPTFNPLILEGASVSDAPASVRTDEFGYAKIDLLRGAKYQVLVGNAVRIARVPDAPSASLPAILFPVVSKINGLLENVVLPVGESLILTPQVIDSAGVPLVGTATSDVRWSIADDTVATLTVTSKTLELKGRSPGTTSVTATRLDQSVVVIPDKPIEGQPLTLTVV
jgi:hypothetical protein